MMKEMPEEQFYKFRDLIYQHLGISLALHKNQMVQSRLNKVMRQLGISSYDHLYQLLIEQNSEAWLHFTHEVTTHKTDFFRESSHFEFIQAEIQQILQQNPRIQENKEIRVWSAGCSSGEEPYTIAMVLNEVLTDDITIRILATDISSQVIAQAVRGFYKNPGDELNEYYLKKYFINFNGGVQIKPEVKNQITFRTFNLMKKFPFKDKFDIIFCRNVMIYFDNLIQEELIEKYYNFLVSGGLLFIGHSESLANKQNRFKYVRPTIYLKPSYGKG